MSIEFSCPNGHKLKVKDDSAGKTGRCPVCNALVRVPRPPSHELSEDAILGILGRHEPKQPSPATEAQRTLGDEAKTGTAPAPVAMPKKSCRKCHREIDWETHICPHCHTFIAGLTDF